MSRVSSQILTGFLSQVTHEEAHWYRVCLCGFPIAGFLALKKWDGCTPRGGEGGLAREFALSVPLHAKSVHVLFIIHCLLYNFSVLFMY